jgi:hypothetical protein
MRADYHRLDRVLLGSFGIVAVTVLATSCGGSGGPTTPSQPPLPVAGESANFRYVMTTTAFRAVADSVLSYREAGSFMRFTIDRYGIERVLEFFRISSRTDSVAVIKERFQSAFGVSMDDVEREWLAMLR